MDEVRPEMQKLWDDFVSQPTITKEPEQPEVKEVVIKDGVRPNIQKTWDESVGGIESPFFSPDFTGSPQVSDEYMSEHIGGTLVKPPEQQVGGESIIGKVFDVLSRGEYASANLAKDYIMGKPFNIKSALEGIKGEKKGTYDELSESVFSEWSPWKRKAMGFALAIFADPTTYTPAGTLTIPFKVAKRIPGVKKGLQALKKSPLGEAFIPGAKVPKPYYEAKYYAKKGLEAEEQRIFRQVEKLRKGLSKDDMEKLSYFRQHPDKIHELSPLLKSKLEKIGTIFDDFVTKAETNKIITPEQANKWRGRDVPYLPGYYPARGIRLAKGDMPPSMFEKVRKPTFMKMKKFETLEDAKQLSAQFGKIANAKTVEEANGFIKSLGLENAFGKIANLNIKDIREYAGQLSKHYLPEENVVKLIAYRGIEQARYTARKKFVDNTIETFGKKLPSGTKIVPEGHGIYMPKGAIRMYVTEVLDPAFIKDFRGLADKLKDIRINTEKVATIKKTTETTVTGIGKLAERGPLAKMEEVVRDALTNRGMTIPEANVYIGKLKVQGSDAVDDIIKEVNEKSETIKTILDSKGLEGDLIDISKLTDLQKKQMVGITTKVPTYAFPKEIADDLNYAAKIMGGDPATAKMFQLFDKTQNMWKGFATAVRLPFHMRNMYSNWWQASLSGVKNPIRFVQAADIQKSFITKANSKIQLGEKIYTYKELRTLANNLGVRGKGWLGADIDIKMFDEIDSMVKYGKFRHLTPTKLGRKFGTMIEDNSRFAVFIDQLAKGKSAEDASRAVRKYMFDYEELTDFERKVMKRIIPFYCVSEDTECLTDNGWKLYNEITKTDQVLTYNLASQKLEGQPHTGIHVFNYNGHLIHFKSLNIDLLCTLNHRCITEEYGIKEAINIGYGNHCPMIGENRNPDFKIDDRILSLIGWTITDGHYRRNGSDITLYQKKFNSVVEALLEKDFNSNIHSDTGVTQYGITGKTRKEIQKWFKYDLWTLVFQLSKRQCNILREAITLADGGWSYKDEKREFLFIAQKKETYRDLIQLIWFLAGYNCKLGARGFYERHQQRAKYRSKKVVPYQGKVWCPSTCNTTAIFRRNGQITISGQTWTRKNAPLQIQSLIEQPRKYQAYAKGLRAFEEDETVEERMAKPEYFNKMLYVKSPFKSKLGKSLYMSIDLPPLELNRATDLNQWLSSTTPLKVIPEIIFNFKTFPQPSKLGKPLELIRAPFWVGWLPKPIFNSMKRFSLIDKLMNTNTGEYELGINKKLLHGIHTALPFLNEQSRMHAAPITLDDENPENKRKSYISGIGFKTIDTTKEMGRKMGEVDVRTSYLESFVSQRGRLPTIKEMEELK